MSPRRRRVLWIVGITLAVLFLLVALAGGILLGTRAGARWAVARAAGVLPGDLESGEIEGNLRSPLALDHVVYETPTLRIAIDRLELRWHLTGLLHRHLEVERLAATGVEVTSRPAPDGTTEPASEGLPDLSTPVSVKLAEAKVSDLTIRSAPGAESVHLAQLELAGRFAASKLRLDRLRVDGDGFVAELDGSLETRGDYELDLATRLRLEPGRALPARALVLAGTLGGDLDRLRVEQHVAEAPFEARLDATVDDVIETATVRGQLRLRDLDPQALDPSWPAGSLTATVRGHGGAERLDATAELRLGLTGQGTAEGTLEAHGAPAEWAASGRLQLAVAGVPSFPLRIEARGDSAGATVDRLHATLLGGEVVAHGAVRWQPALDWSAELEVQGLEPQRRWPQMAGVIAARASAAGDADGELRVRLERLGGRLRGQPLAGSGTLAVAGGAMDLRDVDLRWGGARIAARGRVGDPWDLVAQVQVPDLGSLVPHTAGSLSARGRLRGELARAHVEATAHAESLRWRDDEVARAELRADVALGGDAPLDAHLTAQDVVVAGRSITAARIDADGRTTRHRIELVADADIARLQLVARGGYADGVWQGEIEGSEVASDRYGTWQQDAPSPLRVSATDGGLDSTCWRATEQGSICAQGGFSSSGWNLAAELDRLPLGLAEPLLPETVGLTGRLRGSLQARTRGDALSAALHLTGSDIELTLPGSGEEPLVTRLDPVRIEGRAGAQGTEATVRVGVPDAGTAAARIRLPGFAAAVMPPESQPLEGAAELHFDDLSRLAALLPQLADLRGQLEGKLSLGGTVGAPAPAGTLALRQGAASIPALGIEVREAGIEARADGGPGFALSGSARSGGGTLRLSGRGALRPSAETPLELHLVADGFEAVDLETAHAVADADLQLADRGGPLELDGRVTVPTADLTLEAPEARAVTASSDIVFVGPRRPADEAAAEEPAFALQADVQLVLGDDVHVAAMGFEGQPTGRLRLLQVPGRPTRATGEIRFTEGSYEAYGQDLQLEHGRLVFAGPVTEPALDLRAARHASDGVVAGIAVTGTLEAPKVELWSEPPMAESDQLAYVLLGHPLSQASGGEESLLTRAAGSLGMKGGNLLAGKLAARFGLEEASIESEGGYREASLVLGKYLSPKLFVGYGIGLFSPLTTVRIRYRLGEDWILRAESGEATGADLLYTIETGRPPGGSETGRPPGGSGPPGG